MTPETLLTPPCPVLSEFTRRGRSRGEHRQHAVTIDEARRDGRNPELPRSLASACHAALQRLAVIGVTELQDAADPLLISSIVGATALANGQHAFAWLAARFTDEERRAALTKFDKIE